MNYNCKYNIQGKYKCKKQKIEKFSNSGKCENGKVIDGECLPYCDCGPKDYKSACKHVEGYTNNPISSLSESSELLKNNNYKKECRANNKYAAIPTNEFDKEYLKNNTYPRKNSEVYLINNWYDPEKKIAYQYDYDCNGESKNICTNFKYENFTRNENHPDFEINFEFKNKPKKCAIRNEKDLKYEHKNADELMKIFKNSFPEYETVEAANLCHPYALYTANPDPDTKKKDIYLKDINLNRNEDDKKVEFEIKCYDTALKEASKWETEELVQDLYGCPYNSLYYHPCKNIIEEDEKKNSITGAETTACS